MVFKSPSKSPTKGGLPLEDFEFLVPPEAPVFRPTMEEFADPLAYIEKIRSEAEKCGICKIKPPSDWQPPFAVDVDRFKFTPRIQRLNELEAKTRIKLNFLDQIAKFWELQGSSLKIPMVEKRALDLYDLHRIVEAEGGFKAVTEAKKWPKIALRMGLVQSKDIGVVLSQSYERILYPFDVFKQGKILSEMKSDVQSEGEDCSSTENRPRKKEKDYKPHGIVSRQAITPPEEKYARRSKRGFEKKKKEDKKSVKVAETQPRTPSKKNKESVKKTLIFEYDPLAKYVCFACGRGDSEECMLLCDGCDDSHHTFCLIPPITEIPKGDWRCPKCVAMEVSKPMEAFGFEQARREYTLQEFGEMADHFKANYFNMPAHMVPNALVEKEFWRIMGSIDEDVTVEYGADLHTMDHGSGFPTISKADDNLAACDMEYAKSGWNLNNLPCLENSVLGYINVDISGMKVPWMYVGMCFATFCWHNEDHWSYSINYMHWGEPKTWYGVPGDKAEDFETSMKKAAPELFTNQPDLLHQLVTIMNPNILMNAGIPVFRTDQEAGEFVITFPRAYHAGFNQGYNFAEAVNFATPDWLKIGRACIDHYSLLRRFCVFSHDELVCKMASTPKSLDLNVAKAAYEDMQVMVESETKLRKSLLEWGVVEAEREAFELLPDDERQCSTCKTTCFLSAVTCSCATDQLVCLRHCTDLCKCPPQKHTLRYRYTLDELPAMLDGLKLRASAYDEWCEKVETIFRQKPEERTITLPEVKGLLVQAQEHSYPQSDLLKSLVQGVAEAEKCMSIAQQMVNKKLRTRTRQAHESKYKLTVNELTDFVSEIESLCCVLKERDDIRDLLEKVREFQKDATKYVDLVDVDDIDSTTLEKFIDTGVLLDVDLPELVVLKQNLQRINWLEEVAEIKEDESQVTLDVLGRLLSDGVELPPHTLIEKEMAELQLLLMNIEKWDTKAKEILASGTRQPIATLETLLNEAEKIPAFLPSENALRDAIKKARDWISKAEAINSNTELTYLDGIETMVNKGRSIPVQLDLLPMFEEKMKNARLWKDRTARTFLRKNSRYTLMEALSPRTEFGMNVLKLKKKKWLDDGTCSAPVVFDVKLEGSVNAVSVVAAFKGAERQEMTAMRDLRLLNLRKRANDNGDVKYCICRKGATGFMLQCELCKDWFHAACVPLPKSGGSGGSASVGNVTTTAVGATPAGGSGAKPRPTPAQQLAAAASRDVKFLCPCCLRSRRPRLETILALLVSLQKLEVRVPEGEALQCLTERAMNWQDRARTSLSTDEIANALAKLSVFSQKQAEAAAREKTEKIITSELKKAAGKSGNPELERRVRQMSGVAEENITAATEQDSSHDGGNAVSSVGGGELKNETSDNFFSSSGNNAEHAYSTASKTPVFKHPPVMLSEMARAELEELMLEGDLLEVSLDETSHIWRILQATRQKPEKDRLPPMEQLESELLAGRAEKERLKAKQRANLMRKRNIDEHEAQQQLPCFPSSSLSGSPSHHPKTKKPRAPPSDLYHSDYPHHSHQFSPPESSSTSMGTPLKGRRASMKHVRESEMHQRGGSGRKKMINQQQKRRSGGDSGRGGNAGGHKTPVKRRRPVVEAPSSDSDESDSDENCSAIKCLKPLGKEVDWVQCDGGCEKWFHFRCLGINRKDIRDDEDFICHSCSKLSNNISPLMRSQQQSQPHHQQQQSLHHHHHPQPHHHQPQQIPHVMPQQQHHRVKVEPSNLDESLGLDALLSLANAVPDSDNNMNIDNQHTGWQQSNYNYDIEETRAFHHNLPTIPTRPGLNIAQALPNPPEMLLNPQPPTGNNYQMPPENYHHPQSHYDNLLPYGAGSNSGGAGAGDASTPYSSGYPVPNYPITYSNTYTEQFSDPYVLTQLGTEKNSAFGNFAGFSQGSGPTGSGDFGQVLPVKEDGKGEEQGSGNVE